ncbi:hypothetical protein NC651_027805 [Populus alba x Populus x berolinensis]|nr:hypothetical protein NC651_027805 [Populus alba x Populus x berolinensis]
MNFGAPFKRLKNLKVECKCDSYVLPANISTFLRDAEYIKMGERSEEGIVDIALRRHCTDELETKAAITSLADG